MNKEDLKNKITNVKNQVKSTWNKDTGNKDIEKIKTDVEQKDFSGAADTIREKTKRKAS